MKTKILGCLFLLVVFGCNFSKKNNVTNKEADYAAFRSSLHNRTTNKLTQLLNGYISKSNLALVIKNDPLLTSVIILSDDIDFDFVRLGVNVYFDNPSLGLSPFLAWEMRDNSYFMVMGFDNSIKEGLPLKFMMFIYSEAEGIKKLTISTDS